MEIGGVDRGATHWLTRSCAGAIALSGIVGCRGVLGVEDGVEPADGASESASDGEVLESDSGGGNDGTADVGTDSTPQSEVCDETTSCGSCGRECSTAHVSTLACSAGLCTSSCNAGYVNCAMPAAPTPDDGCECEGSDCCAGRCQPKHDNGWGGIYYDCAALGVPGDATTYTEAMAMEAAKSWGPTTGPSTTTCAGSACVYASQPFGSTATLESTWCYSGLLAGRVYKVVGGSSCPTSSGDQPWH
jgi:hypothetical protein